MKKILITGSNGFIARNITARLTNCEITLTNRSNLNPLIASDVDNFFKDKLLHDDIDNNNINNNKLNNIFNILLKL